MNLDVQMPGGSGFGNAMDALGDPSVASSAYINTFEDIRAIRDFLAGARAVRMQKQLYLPKFELESDYDYARRVQFAPLSNYFKSAVRNIVARPFGKQVSLQGEVTPTIREFCEDVDGRGNSLHVFLRETFNRAVSYGRHGILIDYPQTASGQTLADERASGARPYWVHIPAERLIACYTDFQFGRETVCHARIEENYTKRVGFKEEKVQRIRVLDHDTGNGLGPTWAVYEFNQLQDKAQKGQWVKVNEGQFSLPYIPMVTFTTGADENDRILPPLMDLLHLQIEHYQQCSNLKNVLELAGFPMLAGNGIQPPLDAEGQPMSMTVGPRAVLFAPPGPFGSPSQWTFVEPTGTSIQRLMENIERLEQDMSICGMQPLLKSSGGVTATAEAINASRAHATAEAWAMDLKDVAEQALKFTALWYGETIEAEVNINTDFGIELKDTSDTQDVLAARAQGVISTATVWDELRRRDFLGPQFDPNKEAQRIKDDPCPPPAPGSIPGVASPKKPDPTQIAGKNNGGGIPT